MFKHKRKQRYFLFLIAGSIALLLLFSLMPKSIKLLTPCQQRGAVDRPLTIDTDNLHTDVLGWAVDSDGVTRVEARAGNTVLASATPALNRRDVKAALSLCRIFSPQGFVIPLPLGKIPPGTKDLHIVAITRSVKEFTVGVIKVDLAKPFGVLDSADAFRWDGRNVLEGWAIGQDQDVNVRILAQDKEILNTKANRSRDDVGKAFAAWPQAGRAGFEAQPSMNSLPRGRYPIKILLESKNNQVREIAGPEVINDLPLGIVLAQSHRMVDPQAVHIRSWLADEQGIQSAQLETEAGQILGQLDKVAANVSLSVLNEPRLANAEKSLSVSLGDLFQKTVPLDRIPDGLQRIVVRAKDNSGVERVLPGPLVLKHSPSLRANCPADKVRLYYPGETVNWRDNFPQMQEFKLMVEGGCVEVGFRGRVEYLRTTHGKDHDYNFDPDFPDSVRVRDNIGMTTSSLNELLNAAVRLNSPLLITLDGGVWADSKFSIPDYDVVDKLEEDPRHVQWNQFGQAEADDALKDLPGSVASPQLARMMSLNFYNEKFRAYKKRNLQAAARTIADFIRQHPQAQVIVNMDPDEYINPWFYLTQWYDYNPDALRQYREWLFHLGPYADGEVLAATRHTPQLTLAEANKLAGQNWTELSQVDPPRGTLDYGDPWQQLWTQFKRHLVAQHYSDLADWAVEAGLSRDQIYTGQTFIQTDVAVSINDTATGWTDQAGVSIAGAKPRQGHLGAILYGRSSRDEGRPRSGHSLINNILKADAKWGVGEFHPASIAFPEKLPSHAESYATMSSLLNGGAHYLSPMWGSYASDRDVNRNSFAAYHAMEGTSFEYQLVWGLRAMQSLPAGSLLYPFGNAMVNSADGWSAGQGSELHTELGKLRVTTHGERPVLHSPGSLSRSLNIPSRLSVTGSWPESTTATATVVLDTGKQYALPLSPQGSLSLTLDLPIYPERQMSSLTLSWDIKPGLGNQEVKLDSVTWSPLH